ncbi:hypothetical protein B0H12DRAFT_1070195 [Mycena haematopus]|nr:hypothetical protein B0H12DRAFT_1070195 [Mycena haematopus]
MNIKRQSRVIIRKSTGAGLLLEEPSSSSMNSMKAKRRLGVSDLRIPPTSLLFTAVQDLDDSEDATTLDESGRDFTVYSSSSSSASESSGSESPMSSAPTTPTPSPTVQNYAAKLVRCKTIKPLIITKRSASPSSSALPAAPRLDEQEDDDNEYYATHAAGFITLTPPLPPSFPASALFSRRESAIVPAPATSQLSPLGIITPPSSGPSHSRSRSPHTHHATRPPPRTPVPTDALSGDYTAYAPAPRLLLTPSRISASSVPYDVSEDGWEYDDDDDDDAEEELPLSPLLTASPPSSPDADTDAGDRRSFPPPPPSPSPSSPSSCSSPHQPSPQHPALRSRWSASTLSSVRPPSRSPKTFAFARRYFRAPRSASVHPDSKPPPKTKPPPPPKTKKGTRTRLTVKDVLAIATQLAPVTPPSLTMVPSSARSLALPLPPSSARSSLYMPASMPPPVTPSMSVPAAPGVQNVRRRAHARVGTRETWSYPLPSSSFANDEANGHSDAEADWWSDESGSGGRKPIPVEMFLR